MFKKFKTLESGFKGVRQLAVLCLLASVLISGWAIYWGTAMADAAKARIYVLSTGKVMEAVAALPADNLLVEARDHLRTFHHYFFDLSSDEKAIKASIDRSFYLADGSVKKLYDNLLESGFISGLVSGNITQSVALDSISIYSDQGRLAFRCMGLQTLMRSTSLTTRAIVTRGFLRIDLPRSDNNPHGMLVEGFEVEQNKEIKTIKR